MAKGQMRSGKEPRKPKSDKKKTEAAKHLRPHELIASAKGVARPPPTK